jgi:hypothetical protein
MKSTSYLLMICLLVLVITSIAQEKYASFGAEISEANAVGIDNLNGLNESDTVKMKLKGVVSEVCQAKGCWMTLETTAGVPLRVTFKDYGFFVPKDISGKEVIVEGMVSKSVLSEKMAKHYADDAGEEYDPSKEYLEFGLVAEGVLVSQE